MFDGIVRISENPIARYESFSLSVRAATREGEHGFSQYQHEHRAEDGFYRCEFSLTLDLQTMVEFVRNGLSRLVRVYDPTGTEILWEGVVWELELDIDSVRIRNTLEGLYNRVMVRYRLPGTGTTLRSTWAEDTTSIKRYGKREMVLSGGELETSVANQVAQSYLALHKNPKPYSTSLDIGEPANRIATLRVSCRGISETWGWRTYNQTTLTGNASASTVIQNILGQPNLLRNMVAWYDLEETGTTDERLDAFSTYNLMPVFGPTYAAGRVGNAASFAVASTQCLKRDSSASDEFAVRPWVPFTGAAWVYLASKPAAVMMIGCKWYSSAPVSRYWAFRWSNTSDRFEVVLWDSAGAAVTLAANTFGAPAINTWYFVCMRYDPALTRAYISVNAGAEDSANVPGGRCEADVGAASLAAPFNIGGRYTLVGPAVGVPWDGRIDSFGFWRRCLTTDERTWLYNSGNGRNFDALSYMQYVRESVVVGNATLVSQVTDVDRRAGEIVKDIGRLGDPNYRRWLCYMDSPLKFVYEEAARPTYQVT